MLIKHSVECDVTISANSVTCAFVADYYFVYCVIFVLYCYVNLVERVRPFFSHGLLAGLTRFT
jgi:hypothetical protein